MTKTIHTEATEQAPATVLQFTTRGGATVTVTGDNSSSSPYSWTCSAGDASATESYASLPFCRDDAEAHANACQAKQGVVEEPRTITYPLDSGGSVTSTCPAWCTYDHTDDVASGLTEPSDLFHQGDAVSLGFTAQGVEQSILDARIAQWPFSQDDKKPYVELVPEGRTAVGRILASRLELDDEIRRVRAHLRELLDLGDQLAEAQADDHARHFLHDDTAWMTFTRTDLQSLPIAYLLRVFGVTVVETEDIGRRAVAALYGEPGAMELRIKPDMSQYLREDQARRLLLDWYEARHGGAA
ncbi:DUF6907 domain-containing protein [Streptomyces fulvoviolaceus]|uniref:DUF6907 domain-containing protein n=1 Tax=Streptomyces fulvoviolaceus TaxID=285535 RepID=UPI0021C070BB|nr:hypothetical protein [Streptomyces fulvoviolaceus]MCT9078818.1 hypothetical protein [Streptomyces fulvoviolaceus]